MSMTKEEFDELLHMSTDVALHSCEGATGFTPVLTVAVEDEGRKALLNIFIMADDFNDEAARRRMFAGIGGKVAREMPEAELLGAFFASEAWARKAKMVDGALVAGDEKTEMLTVMGLSTDETMKGASMTPIVRDAEERMSFGESTYMPDSEPELLRNFMLGFAMERLTTADVAAVCDNIVKGGE